MVGLFILSLSTLLMISCNYGGVGAGAGNTPSAPIEPWTSQIGVATKQTNSSGIAFDSNLNVYVTGDTAGSLGGTALTGSQDMFLIKYDSNGTQAWTQLLGSINMGTYGSGVVADSSGNIYVAGTTGGNLPNNTLTGITDLFLSKYSTSGALQWVKQLGVASTYTNTAGLAKDSSNNLYITGGTSGNLSGETRTGSKDMFIVKYDSNGNHQWTRLLGVATKNTYGESITTDKDNNIVVSGATYGALPGGTLSGYFSVFVTKYSSSGTRLWITQFGGQNYSEGYGVTTDSNGDVYVTGYANGALPSNSQIGSNDLFIAKMNGTSGTIQWIKPFGISSGNIFGRGIGLDSNGHIFIIGDTSNLFSGSAMIGLTDVVLVKFDSNGNHIATNQYGATGSYASGNAIAIGPTGQLAFTGTSDGNFEGKTLVGTRDVYTRLESQ